MNIPIGKQSNIDYVFIQDSSSTTGAGLTGVTSASSGLAGRYIYPGGTSVALTFETISTLGTYQAPTSNAHLRIKELDSTNHPGVYELHYHNDWFSTGNARTAAILTIKGVTNMAQLNHLVTIDYALQPATAARTLTVSSTGAALANLGEILGTALTETAGYLAAGFKKFFNVATPTSTMNQVTLVDTTTTLTNAPSDSSGVTTLLSRLSSARAGYLDNLSAGAVALASSLSSLQTDVTTLLSRITSTLFSGITSLAQWLGLIAGKQTGNSTARTELRATGAGSGTYDETTDSLEAVRDRGDAAWTTIAAVAIRSAIGLGSANLDTQLTNIEAETSDIQSKVNNVTYGLSAIKTLIDTLTAYVDTEVAAIKAKTDNLPTDPADESNIQAAIANLLTYVDTEVAAILAAVDTEIAAIKAKTDNLPSDPADESLLEAAIADLKTYVDTEILAIKAKTDLIPASPAAVGSPMTLDLTQALDTTPVTDSVGEALLGAISELGDETVVGVEYTKKTPGGATAVVFDLDDADAPTSRTRQ